MHRGGCLELYYCNMLEWCGIAEFAGLENDGLEQEQTYVLHTLKTFNVYDM